MCTHGGPSSRTCDRTESRPPPENGNPSGKKEEKIFFVRFADGKRKKNSSAAWRPMTTDESQHEHRVINTPAASRVQDRCEDVASEATEFARARDNRDRNRWNGKEASPKDFLRVLTDATPPTENVRPPAGRNPARRTEIPAGSIGA